MSTRRALLVAINSYPDAPLNGCLSDLKLMYKILKEKYAFTEFVILDEKKATKKNWIGALTELGKKSQPNDWLVQAYSGHGSQIPCNNDTISFEQDSMDEIVIPYDFSWDVPLRDDNFNSIIMSVNPAVNMVFFHDCCHAAHGLRNSPPTKNGQPMKNRYLPPPLHVVLESGEMDLDDELNLATSRSRTDKLRLKPFMRNATDQGNAILISGCKDNQTSSDFYAGNGLYHGAMTFYLAQTLKEAGWKIPYSKLVEIMNSKLKRDGFDQEPQLESKAEFFNKNFLE